MKSNKMFSMALFTAVILGLAATLYAETPPLHTDGNRIKDPNGNIVVLRGVDLIDLGFLESWQGGAINMVNRLTNKNDTQSNSPGWYPRVLRINITPADAVPTWPNRFDPGNDTFYNTLLRPVVDYCKTKDLYVIIDWHYVANTYDHVATTSAFWEYMALRFANDSHVLFELFNEPINDLNGDWIFNANDTADWLSVRTDMQTWYNIVRTYAPNNLVLVAGPFYSQVIGPSAANPLTGNNIVMVSHIYPGHWLDSYWLPSYQNQINTALTRYPVFMSEWGFSVDSDPALQGTITNYGLPVSDWREARKISNSAWVASYDWGPPMFYTDWTLRVGEGQMGGFVKDKLYEYRNNDQPGGQDTTPPAAPTGLTATGGESQVSLDWTNNAELDLAGYNVYRSTIQGSGYEKINLSLVTTSAYTDNNVDGYVTYYYVVTAVDTSTNESVSSNEASATPVDTTPPAVPAGLTATAGDGVVSLNWNDNAELDLAGYNVYRSTTQGSGYGKINGPLVTTSDYIDNTVTNGLTYFYVVTAEDTSSNESASSGEVSARPNILISTTYNFVGINAADTNYNAYACDVDVFPFAGDSANRNSQVEATDGQYINISADDIAEWATLDPGSSDQILLWIEMKINELPADIVKIDLTFDGYTNGGTVTHRIFVLTAGADWTQNSSWTQVGTDQSIPTGTYATMTRSITSNFSNYIDSNGKITWAVYETRSSDAMRVNYIETKAYRVYDPVFPNAPTGLTATPGLGTVILDWNDNYEPDLAGYNVYRMPEGGSYEKVNGPLVTVSNYTDTAVSIGTTYYYVVTAVDTSINESDPSNEASATRGSPSAGTGAILSEWWTGVSGTAVSDLTEDANYPDNPSGKELLITLEGPLNWADYYGTRIRGYLNPISTGSYTFWIASDNDSQLRLSTDDNPANVSLIASVSGYTPSRFWTKYPSQQSSPVSLTGGQKYYIEILHKEHDGGDNLAVAWQGPGISQQIIDGIYLSPCCLDFEIFAGFAEQWGQTGCNAGNDYCFGFDFGRDGSVSIDDLKAFADAWLAGI